MNMFCVTQGQEEIISSGSYLTGQRSSFVIVAQNWSVQLSCLFHGSSLSVWEQETSILRAKMILDRLV